MVRHHYVNCRRCGWVITSEKADAQGGLCDRCHATRNAGVVRADSPTRASCVECGALVGNHHDADCPIYVRELKAAKAVDR
jgi:ribosomal protein S27E